MIRTLVRSHLFFLFICMSLFALSTLVLIPGFMTGDGSEHLYEAKRQIYGDWHPPLMAWVWHFLDQQIPGSTLLFLLHGLFLWVGIGFFCFSFRESENKSFSLGLLLCTGLWPLIWIVQGSMLKDAGFVAALCLATGALALYLKKRSSLLMGVVLLMLFYAMGMRHNAIFAVLPLCVLIAKVTFRNHSFWAGLGLTAAIFGGVQLFEKTIIRPYSETPTSQILLYDIVGTSVHAGKNYLSPIPEFGKQIRTLEQFLEMYTPNSNYWIYWGDDRVVRFPFMIPLFEESRKILFQDWFRAVSQSPWAYLTHRTKVFLGILGLTEHVPPLIAEFQIVSFLGGPKYEWNLPIRQWIQNILPILPRYPLYSPLCYLLILGFVMIGIYFKKPSSQKDLLLAVGMSGVLYEISYFLIGVSADFRYSWWPCLTSGWITAAFLFQKEKSFELKSRLHSHVHRMLIGRRRIHSLCRALSPHLQGSQRLIDLGCGDGRLSHELLKKNPQLQIQGFDVLERPAHKVFPIHRYDGTQLPVSNQGADTVLLVDVLHHAENPFALLQEATRVSTNILIKDHLLKGWLSGKILAFMDWVGNRPHGVSLPHHYWSQDQWEGAFQKLGLVVTDYKTNLGLYPWPFNLVFEKNLHFVAKLQKTYSTDVPDSTADT